MAAILILILVGVVVFIGWSWSSWRDKRILAKTVPPDWLARIREAIPFYDRLLQTEQQQLLDNIRLFLAKKRFYGCAGLMVTDRIRLTIAAQACLLLLNRKTSLYTRLKPFVVYPDALISYHGRHNDDGTLSDHGNGLLGESWHYGKIILSWDDVQRGVCNPHNVVLPEFSHQLDSESGSANGAPVRHTNSYTIWASILSHEFAGLTDGFQHHHTSVMDYFGATNPAEFFAVATETFFEKPDQLKGRHPALFEVLKTYYAVDPSAWQ
ncbi:MAG: M90 family metallopeptidase [Pseudohongiellaceae bacterium]